MVALASAFVRVRPQTDKREFRKAAEEVGAEAGKAFGEEFTKGSDGKLRDSRVRFVKDSEKAGEDAGKRTGKSFGKGLTAASSGSSGAFSKALSLMSAKLVIFGGAAAAATPGVLQLTAALAPAAGVVAGLPAAFGGAKAAMLTFKVATAGVGDAIKAGLTGTAKQAEKALEELPPAARKFSKSIIGLKPQLDGLRASVAERFFRPLTDDVRPLAEKYLPMLKTQMSNLAGPLGGLAEQLTETARRSQVFNAVTAIFKNTRISVILLRDAIDPLVRALAAVVTATAGKLPGLAQGFANLAKDVGAFIQQAAKSGAIGRFFQAGIDTLKKLAGIVINVGTIIATVFGAATASGADLLSSIRALTGEAAAFLKSVQGTTALGAIFSTLAQFGQALRTSLGAVLPAIAQSLEILGPAIAGLATPFSQLVIAIAPLLPLFAGIAATLITKLTPAIAAISKYLSENATAVKILTGAVAAFLVVQKLANVAIAIQAAGGLLLYLKGIQLVTAATKIWTGVQAAFTLVMNANPILLAVTAIAALVAGIIYAYKHSETFRAIVQAVWAAIRAAVKATVDWIVNVAWPAIVKAWQAIAAAGLWLWHNVLEPVWHGIQNVISFVVTAVKAYIGFVIGYFRLVASVALWLWHNIFEPVFAGIRKAVEIWWLAVQIIFKLLYNILRTVIGNTLDWLGKAFSAVFNYIKNNVIIPWWNIIKAVFSAVQQYVIGPFLAAFQKVKTYLTQIFLAIGLIVRQWYATYIAPAFAAAKRAWELFQIGLSYIWNQKIKPLFQQFVDFIKKYVVGGFKTGVDAIAAAWDKVREAARKPVAFVVNKIINPFIGGLNRAAALVGVKDRVEPIKGFATGGQIPGYATGGKISGAPSAADNRLAPATIPGVGAVKLAGGEYVVNAQDTAKALPLLKWVNAGMKGGARAIGRYLGRPVAEMPGDGSEGWAFKDGGLVGWTKDIWSAISDPATAIKKPFESLLNQIPGSGMIKDFLGGAAKRLLNGAISWLVGGSGEAAGGSAMSTARAVRARTFVQSQAGKPYIWADAGPAGYDCSGIVSAAYNILKGNTPYSHTFSTGSLPGPWFDTGRKIGTLIAGWSHPGQSPASASVGHMAGQIAGMPFESTGSSGVRIGDRARMVGQFANIGAARAMGGLIGEPVRLFDEGGLWPTGTLGANLSGRTEYVNPDGRGRGGNTYIINQNIPVGAHPVEVGRQTVLAIKAFEGANGTGWRDD